MEKRFAIRHADALMNIEFEPLREAVKGLIAEGLTLLCGAPKVGKSWFMLDMCCAVSSGRPFLGLESAQGDVLYLALEDSERRLKSRLGVLGESPMSTLSFATSALPINDGLLDQMNDWVKHSKNPQMIVIDTLQKIRGIISSRANIYSLDYEIIGRLKAFADKYHIALVVVHHLNKGKSASDDPFDRVNGSTGLTAAADTTIILDRERGTNNAKAIINGRDVQIDNLTLRMDNGRWLVVGKEQIEREAYNSNPIVRTVKTLLGSAFGGVVKITSDDFRDAIAETCGNCPYGTLDAASKAVSAISPDLLRFDGIITERVRLGTKNGLRFISPSAGRSAGQ